MEGVWIPSTCVGAGCIVVAVVIRLVVEGVASLCLVCGSISKKGNISIFCLAGLVNL